MDENKTSRKNYLSPKDERKEQRNKIFLKSLKRQGSTSKQNQQEGKHAIGSRYKAVQKPQNK